MQKVHSATIKFRDYRCRTKYRRDRI